MSSILNISEAASLAMHAIVILAKENDRRVSLHEIARGLEASTSHLSKVMQRMVKEGWIHSTRGPLGGFQLHRSALEISMLEVYELFDGRLTEGDCLFASPLCAEGVGCLFGGLLFQLNQQVTESLSGKKISNFIGNKSFYK
jgi:Rrf2 family protein